MDRVTILVSGCKPFGTKLEMGTTKTGDTQTYNKLGTPSHRSQLFTRWLNHIPDTFYITCTVQNIIEEYLNRLNPWVDNENIFQVGNSVQSGYRYKFGLHDRRHYELYKKYSNSRLWSTLLLVYVCLTRGETDLYRERKFCHEIL